MPTAEERAEMRALDAKLDAFAAMLKRRSTAPGGGITFLVITISLRHTCFATILREQFTENISPFADKAVGDAATASALSC
jgi:hypothetical protein